METWIEEHSTPQEPLPAVKTPLISKEEFSETCLRPLAKNAKKLAGSILEFRNATQLPHTPEGIRAMYEHTLLKITEMIKKNGITIYDENRLIRALKEEWSHVGPGCRFIPEGATPVLETEPVKTNEIISALEECSQELLEEYPEYLRIIQTNMEKLFEDIHLAIKVAMGKTASGVLNNIVLSPTMVRDFLDQFWTIEKDVKQTALRLRTMQRNTRAMKEWESPSLN